MPFRLMNQSNRGAMHLIWSDYSMIRCMESTVDLEIEKIVRSNVSDEAMDALLNLIRRGVLRPGNRLPSQRQLVSRMGLSQTAIREALRGLASIGVIEVHAGRGAFVRSVSPEMLIRPESLFFILQRETLLQVLE